MWGCKPQQEGKALPKDRLSEEGDSGILHSGPYTISIVIDNDNHSFSVPKVALCSVPQKR